MFQSDCRCSHGNATSLFFGITVEVTECTGETFADDAIGFDEVVGEGGFAMIDVGDDCDEACRVW